MVRIETGDSSSSKATWIGGSLQAFREDPLTLMSQLHQEHGDYAKFRLGPKKFYAVFDPDMLKEIMVTKADSFSKAGTFDEIKRLTGEGLVLSNGEYHDRQRRLLQPKLSRNQIQKYAQQMTASTLAVIDTWKHGEQRELTRDLFDITFDIIARTMFSYDSSEKLRRIGKAFVSINRIAAAKIRALVRIPLLIPTSQNREYLSALRTLDEIVFSLIADRRSNPTDEHEQQDLLSALMNARDEEDQTGLTDQQLRDELMTMFLAGHETTAFTLAWAIDYILRHPEVEEKLVQEWSEVLGGDAPAAQHYGRLTYTQNVLWETLRLRPAGYITGRTAEVDVQVGSLKLSQGEAVMISPYPLHISETYFKDPFLFRPERFENDYVKTIPLMAYFPFGAGPRSCIGNHFAMMEMVLILASIGQKFKLRYKPGQPPLEAEALLTLAPKGDIYVTIEQRDLD